MEMSQNNRQDENILSNEKKRELGKYIGKYILPEDLNDGDEEVRELLEGKGD